MSIWLLAADHEGTIPNDPKLVQKLCYMGSEPDLEALAISGFLEIDDILASTWRQHDAPEIEKTIENRVEVETEAENTHGRIPEKPQKKKNQPIYTPEFEEFWKLRPRRKGPDPKEPAAKLFHSFVKNGVDVEEIMNGLRLYKESVRGKEQTEYVQHTRKWLYHRGWEDDYDDGSEERDEYLRNLGEKFRKEEEEKDNDTHA